MDVPTASYYLFLDPDELWTYNYCMHLPYVETERGAVEGISCCFPRIVDLYKGWPVSRKLRHARGGPTHHHHHHHQSIHVESQVLLLMSESPRPCWNPLCIEECVRTDLNYDDSVLFTIILL